MKHTYLVPSPSVRRNINHAQIAKWRREQAIIRTLQRRPELLDKANLNLEERQLVDRLRNYLSTSGETY